MTLSRPSDDKSSSLWSVSLRTLIVALLLTIVAVRYQTISQIQGLGAIPQIHLAVLLLLVALQPLLSKLRLQSRDVIVIYCFVTVAASCYDGVSRFLPAYTVPTYSSAPENNYAMLADRCIPSWFIPKDPEIIRMYYEGAPDGTVPWRAWLGPTAVWMGFFMVLWGTLHCVVSVLRRYWVEHEHLAFPVVTVPLYIAAAGSGRLRPRKTVWGEPLMWVGFAISMLHFLSIMLHGLNPGVPTLGTNFDVGKLFTEKPLDALRPLSLFIYNPSLAGFAYFAPQDLCFSMWFFFLFWFKPIALIYRIAGLQPAPGFPFYWEQSAGAFIAIALFYAWAARGFLKRVWQAALSGEPLAKEGEPNRFADHLTPRVALLGGACGFVSLCIFYNLAGMSWWVATLFFAMIILFATIFTRGRAESGVSYTSSFPFWQASRQLKSFLGSAPLMPGGSYSNLVHLGSLIFLHFGDYPECMTYQMESLKLGEEVRVKTSHMSAIIMGAMLVGLIVVFQTFLSQAYGWGMNTLQGGTTQGGYHVSISRAEWDEISSVAEGTALLPDWNRNGFTIGAFGFTLLLVALRQVFPRSPFHPLGFVMTTSYGYAYWGSFLAIWAVKSVILRLGGVRLYHQLTPVFVGLVLGQIFALSAIWPLFAAFAGDDWKALADPLIYF